MSTSGERESVAGAYSCFGGNADDAEMGGGVAGGVTGTAAASGPDFPLEGRWPLE